ncbi:MAG: glycosyltransferase family 4 protein [bacterium]
MNIAIDISFFLKYPFSGIGQYTRRLIEGLSRVDPANDYTLFPPGGSDGSSLSLGRNFHYSYKPELRNFDVVHYPYFTSPEAFENSVVTVHDLIPLLYRRDRFNPGFYRMTSIANALRYASVGRDLRRVSRIISVSNTTKEDIVGILGIPSERIEVIYEAAGGEFRVMGEEEVCAAVSKFGIRSPYILHVGGGAFRKNARGVVEAYKLLPAPLRREFSLVLVGDMGRRFKDDLAGMPKARGFVFALGGIPTSDLPAVYNGASLFVFPSIYEGFGLPVLEAFACGVPVVASNSSSLAEIARGAARLVDPFDPAEIASSMEEVLENPELRVEMREMGLSRAREFSWERAAERTLEVYRGVMSRV